MYHTFRVTTSTNNSSSTEGKIAQQNFCRKRLNRHYLIIIQKTRNVYQHIHSLTFTTSLLSVPLAGFPRSWKIIENPGKINFPGKSWKID